MSRQYIWLKDREINDSFSRWLYYSILNKYGSIDQFSYVSGICKSSIYAWITGIYRPNCKNLAILLKMFQISFNEIFDMFGEN